jgi:hypothetical protein
MNGLSALPIALALRGLLVQLLHDTMLEAADDDAAGMITACLCMIRDGNTASAATLQCFCCLLYQLQAEDL